MNAVDTNVVVRLLSVDDPTQTKAVRELFQSCPIWIAKTVLLEAEWVLRSTYGFSRHQIHQAFTLLVSLDSVSVEDPFAVREALALSANGIDFADALHFTSRPREATFVTFDRTLVRRAIRAGATAITEL